MICARKSVRSRSLKAVSILVAALLVSFLYGTSAWASSAAQSTPTWLPRTAQSALIVATPLLLLWWKRAWVQAWIIWLQGLLGELLAAFGPRHHVIHDRRYLEDIIQADLEHRTPEETLEQQRTGSDRPRSSGHSVLPQKSGRRQG